MVHSDEERATATMGPPTGSHTVSATVTPNSAYRPAPVSGLQDLLNRVMSSPVGARIVNAYSQYGGLPSIRLAGEGEMPDGVNGQYYPGSNTVLVRASLLQQKPEQAAVTLAHELFHGLDGVSGMSDWIA